MGRNDARQLEHSRSLLLPQTDPDMSTAMQRLKSVSVEHVGCGVGRLVGCLVRGRGVGARVGLEDGAFDGLSVGDLEGLDVGGIVGYKVGDLEGKFVGLAVGDTVGYDVGALVPSHDPTTSQPCLQSELLSNPGSNPYDPQE